MQSQEKLFSDQRSGRREKMCFGRRTPDPRHALLPDFPSLSLSSPCFRAKSVSPDLKVSEHKDLKNQELKSSPSSLRAEGSVSQLLRLLLQFQTLTCSDLRSRRRDCRNKRMDKKNGQEFGRGKRETEHRHDLPAASNKSSQQNERHKLIVKVSRTRTGPVRRR